MSMLPHPPSTIFYFGRIVRRFLDKGNCEGASEAVAGGRIPQNRKEKLPPISKTAP